MNKYEFIFLLLAELLVLLYLHWQFKSWRVALSLTILTVLPIYLSLERASQFLTGDARYIILEPLSLANSSLSQWFYGALRTTDTSLGLLSVGLHNIFPEITEIQSKIILKNFHWTTGFVILFWIYHLLSKGFVSESNKKTFFVIFVYTAFLLPTNNLALKIFNYDLLSMLFGILALLYLLTAIKYKNPRYALIGIIISFLAAQEKVSASPILILSLAVYGYLVGTTSSRYGYVRSLWGVSLSFIVAISTGVICLLIVAGIQHWNVTEDFLWSITDPFVSWSWVVMRFIFGITNFKAYAFSLLALSFLTSYLLAIVLLTVDKFLVKHSGWWLKVTSYVNLTNTVLIFFVLLVGGFGTYYVDAYWDPYFPIKPGNYHPTTEMNGATWHFGAASLWYHVISFIAYAYAVFINAMPSIYWLSIIGGLIATRILQREQKTELGTELLITTGIALPLIFGLGQIPVSNKFLNIGLFLTAIGIILKTTASLTGLSVTKKATFCFVFVTLLILEVLPFRPVYGAFRPIWSHYDDSNTPILGQLNPSWLGWGEEAMLAGQHIETQCRISGNNTLNGIPCESITLYVRYWGEWLNENTNIKVLPHNSLLQKEEFSYPATDYYVINRLAIVQSVEFPMEVEPEFVISFRGYIIAWVFRFDRIKEGGYELTRLGPYPPRWIQQRK